ncbi:hypothetical protein [Micromonospora sp. CPCC 206061]|uniref:hypothetical protein n=1 Tax=Micromonospora sp. CPCC 206061 TaxID=3122410 RepID=UPI002FEFF33E
MVNFANAEFSGGTVHFGAAEFSGGTVNFADARFFGGTVVLASPDDWSIPPVGLDWASPGLRMPSPEYLAKIAKGPT